MRRLLVAVMATVILGTTTPRAEAVPIVINFKYIADVLASPGVRPVIPERQQFTVNAVVGRVAMANPHDGTSVAGNVSLNMVAESDANGDSSLRGSGTFALAIQSDDLLPGGGRLAVTGVGSYQAATGKVTGIGTASATWRTGSGNGQLVLGASITPTEMQGPVNDMRFTRFRAEISLSVEINF